MQNYIIIANGSFLPKEVIQEASQNCIILALDGAVNKLTPMGIQPQIILGDFDSISHDMALYWGVHKEHVLEPYQGKQGALIVPAMDQEFTDLDKAIQYCDQQKAASITLICAAGGRMDHHESVRMSLRKYYKSGRPLVLHTEQQTLFFARNESLTIHGQAGDYCGIIATKIGSIRSQGLRYECWDHEESTSNSLVGTSAEIQVQGEALIIAPPYLAAQREYMGKEEKERVKVLLRDLNANE